ncbi:hypothetical protein [Nonomuraea sp. LPB2021202275-12-8]
MRLALVCCGIYLVVPLGLALVAFAVLRITSGRTAAGTPQARA